MNSVLILAGEAGLDRDSVALCHQIRALDRRKLLYRIGDLAPERLSEIELAMVFVLGMAPYLEYARTSDGIKWIHYGEGGAQHGHTNQRSSCKMWKPLTDFAPGGATQI